MVDNPQQRHLQRGPTPIDVFRLSPLLCHYPDKDSARQTAEGFTVGFRIPVPPPTYPSFADNLRSVRGLEDVVRQKINKEVAASRVIGLFDIPPIPQPANLPTGSGPQEGLG